RSARQARSDRWTVGMRSRSSLARHQWRAAARCGDPRTKLRRKRRHRVDGGWLGRRSLHELIPSFTLRRPAAHRLTKSLDGLLAVDRRREALVLLPKGIRAGVLRDQDLVGKPSEIVALPIPVATGLRKLDRRLVRALLERSLKPRQPFGITAERRVHACEIPRRERVA